MKRALLVTGSEIGSTGYAIAERFAKEGYNIVMTCLDGEDAQKAAQSISEKYDVSVLGYQLDLLDTARMSVIFEDIDKNGFFVETLCLNAADLDFTVNKVTDFFDIEQHTLQRVLNTNIVGNFMLVKQAAIRMREHKKGAIVFLCSNSALRPNRHRLSYITSKGGIYSMSRALAVDLGTYGIRSNVIMPGTIKTSRWYAMGDKQVTNGSMMPIGDISDFEDIANAAWYLGSDQSKNVTGTEVTVDGGSSCQLFPELLNELRGI